MQPKTFTSSADFVAWVHDMRNTPDFAREYQAIEYRYADKSSDAKTRRAGTQSRTIGSALRSAANGGGVNLLRREKIDSAGGVTITCRLFQ